MQQANFNSWTALTISRFLRNVGDDRRQRRQVGKGGKGPLVGPVTRPAFFGVPKACLLFTDPFGIGGRRPFGKKESESYLGLNA